MDAFLKVGGEAVEGAVFSTFFANDVPINKTSEAFLKAYRDECKKEPPATAALGFDAYRVVLDAITRANSAEPQRKSAMLWRKPSARALKALPVTSPSTPIATPTNRRIQTGQGWLIRLPVHSQTLIDDSLPIDARTRIAVTVTPQRLFGLYVAFEENTPANVRFSTHAPFKQEGTGIQRHLPFPPGTFRERLALAGMDNP